MRTKFTIVLAIVAVCVTTAWAGLPQDRLYWKVYNQPYLYSTDKTGQDVQIVRSASWLAGDNLCYDAAAMDPAGDWIVEYPGGYGGRIRKHEAVTGAYTDMYAIGMPGYSHWVGVDAQYVYKGGGPYEYYVYKFRLSDGAFVNRTYLANGDALWGSGVANDTLWLLDEDYYLLGYPVSWMDGGTHMYARAIYVGPLGSSQQMNVTWDGTHYYLSSGGHASNPMRRYDRSWTSHTDYMVALDALSVMAVSAGPPDTPQLISPSDCAVDVPIDGTLTWNAATGATSYDVYLGTDNPPTTKVSEDQTGTSYDYSGLGYEETYCWKVVAKNIHGETPSVVWSFATTPEPGWLARASLPTAPSGKSEGEGGWLAYNAGNGFVYAAKGNSSADFYFYDPVSDAWSDLTAIPKGRDKRLPGPGCRGVSDGGDRVYMTKGGRTLGFWRYEISTRIWVQLADVPSGASSVDVGTGLSYVGGYVYLLKGPGNEFYRYDPVDNTWTTLANAPGASWLDGSWLAYDGDNLLYTQKGGTDEMYTYDLTVGTWSGNLGGIPPGTTSVYAGHGSAGAWFGGALYALKGNNTSEFWKYVPGSGGGWSALDPMPSGLTGHGRRLKQVDMGGGIIATARMLLAFKGNETNELWRYVRTPEGSDGGGAGAKTTQLPTEFALSVSPNPMKLGTAIRYSVPTATNVSVKLYDVSGALAKNVCNGPVQPGRYTANLSAKGLARGVYILKLASDACNLTRKVVIQ